MAIAYVGAAEVDSSGASTTHTLSVTPSGNFMLIGFNSSDATDTITSVVFNTSETCTRVDEVLNIAGASSFLYYIENPTNTTADIVITSSASITCRPIIAWWYSGADGGFTDSNTGSADPASTLSVAVTPSDDNSWVAGFFGTPGQTAATATSGSTKRNPGNQRGLAVDHNAAITPPASTSVGVDGTSNGYLGIVAAFSPTAGAVGGGRDARALTLLGVG